MIYDLEILVEEEVKPALRAKEKGRGARREAASGLARDEIVNFKS